EDDIMAEELPSYKTELISIENLEKDYYEIKIKKPNDMNWVAGQYMRLGLPTKEITEKKKLRALSFASLPEDDVILLGTRTGRSEERRVGKERKTGWRREVGRAYRVTEVGDTHEGGDDEESD